MVAKHRVGTYNFGCTSAVGKDLEVSSNEMSFEPKLADESMGLKLKRKIKVWNRHLDSSVFSW